MTFALVAGFLLSTTMSFAEEAKGCSASEYKGQSFRGMTVTSGFGSRAATATTNGNTTSSYHRALDLSVTGNPNIGAFHGGTVTHAGPLGGWGNTVVVTNGNFQVQYGHAGSLAVRPGDTISSGQTLGNWSTCSGNCTGPHVDAIYRVNVDGQWHNIDPMIAENLLTQGMDPSSPEFAKAALDATANRCGPNAPTKTMAPGTEESKICQEEMKAAVAQQVEAALAQRQTFFNTNSLPPMQLSQVANTPCMSQELARINRQFGGMVNSAGVGLGLTGSNSITNIMNNSFKGDTNSFNSSASILPGMMNFQSMASQALGGLLSSLGLGSAFSGQVCGMMLDMVLKYIQCENPIKFPSLADFGKGLNLNLPNNCLGQAARQGLMALGSGASARPLSQGVIYDPQTRSFNGTQFNRN